MTELLKRKEMIKEEYVSFETAKLLKEKGFDESIEMVIRPDGTIYYLDTNSVSRQQHITIKNSEINIYSEDVSCPTQQMAMRWLREDHDIFVEVQKTMDGTQYVASLWKGDWYLGRVYGDTVFQTYESAAEFGIRAACEHL